MQLSDAQMPEETAFVRLLSGRFYYLQTCNLEILKLFHPGPSGAPNPTYSQTHAYPFPKP